MSTKNKSVALTAFLEERKREMSATIVYHRARHKFLGEEKYEEMFSAIRTARTDEELDSVDEEINFWMMRD